MIAAASAGSADTAAAAEVTAAACRGRRGGGRATSRMPSLRPVTVALSAAACLAVALTGGGAADAFQIRSVTSTSSSRGTTLPPTSFAWSSSSRIGGVAGAGRRSLLWMNPEEPATETTAAASTTTAAGGADGAAAPDGAKTASKSTSYHPKAGETDHNPDLSPFEPGGGPTVLLDDPPTEVYEKAIGRTLAWVGGAAVFASALLFGVQDGGKTAEEFVAGYLVEQSLSVDNLFVFLLLFDYFKVPLSFQDRVLNWGIYGAIVMRAVLIGLGAAALQNFHAILLVFAAILVYSSANVLLGGEEEEEEMSENAIVKFSHRFIDSVEFFDGDRFFTVVEGVKKATPLFICMIAVEISDVVFAVDSIPAVFGVTENPLVVFTSNMFAIMGLRSLYTILSKAASDLEYLEPAVAIVLGFIGSKMIAEYAGYTLPTEGALAFVATVLAGGVGLSIWSKNNREEGSAAAAAPAGTAEEASSD